MIGGVHESSGNEHIEHPTRSGAQAGSEPGLPEPLVRAPDTRFPQARARRTEDGDRQFPAPDSDETQEPAIREAAGDGIRKWENARSLDLAAQRFGRAESIGISTLPPDEQLALLKTLSDVVAEIAEPAHQLRVANALLETACSSLQMHRGPGEETRNALHPGLSEQSRLPINYARLRELIGDAQGAGMSDMHYEVAVSILASTFHLSSQNQWAGEAELTRLFDDIGEIAAPNHRQAYVSLARMGPDTAPNVASKIFDALDDRRGEAISVWYAVVNHLAQSAYLLEDGVQFEEKFDWLLAEPERSSGGEGTRAHESMTLVLAPLLGKVSLPARQQKFQKLYDIFEKFWEPQPASALASARAARVHVALTCASVALDECDRTREFDRLAANPAPLTERRPDVEPKKIEIQSLAAFVFALSALPEDARHARSAQVERMFESLPVGSRGFVNYEFQEMLRPGNTVAPPLTQAQRRAAEAQWQALFDHK